MKTNKVIKVVFSDKSEWYIPAHVVADNRAKYYAKLDSLREGLDYNNVYKEEYKSLLEDEDLLIDWAENNMEWGDIKMEAKIMKEPRIIDNYGDEWTNSEKVVLSL